MEKPTGKYIVLDGECGYSIFSTITEVQEFIAEIGKPFTKIYKQMTLAEEKRDRMIEELGY